MNKELLRVALRQKALYLPSPTDARQPLTVHTLTFVNELRQMGFTLTEDALATINALGDDDRQTLLDVFNDVMGTKLNWAALVRGWLVPTGESRWDHFVTLIANILRANGHDEEMKGTTLPCGHFIPDGTFPLERYTGCPFCGKPFQTADFVYRGQGSKLRQLQLWGEEELLQFMGNLLTSPVALDATQRESLVTLLESFQFTVHSSQFTVHSSQFTVDSSQFTVHSSQLTVHGSQLTVDCSKLTKETTMLVIDALVDKGRDDEAGQLFASPADVLRYLWYRHTGYVQVLRPHTLLYITRKNQRYEWNTQADINASVEERQQKLKLKYDRPWCRRVARWLNTLITSHPSLITSYLEQMHPKREMWVRFIHALRLAEYARKPGYEGLAMLLDRFYCRDYEVWQGQVDDCMRNLTSEIPDKPELVDDTLLPLLQQRPGLFARCLFSTMLTYGPDRVLNAFSKVADRLAPRLLLTLGYQAQLYFDHNARRVARPLSGVMKDIPPHPLLVHYSDEQLNDMAQAVNRLFLEVMRKHYAQAELDKLNSLQGRKIFIEPQLFNIPMAVGDRSNTVQDVSAALQGTRFPVQGDHVRLFLQWGKGLPAQPLDMDLSCYILLAPTSEEGHADGNRQANSPAAEGSLPPSTVCSYFSLDVPGAKHSGDIREIPDQVGTAEYIELSLPELLAVGAQRVVFTCNAYTGGELTPNLMVGWMSAEQPMTVSEETGVAYDPSTVDHLVRITETNLSKGLIFGVLDVAKREITWLEMPFDGQTVLSISPETVDAYLRRLQAKPTIGQLLTIRAEACGMTLVDNPAEANEQYDTLWAQDTARVSQVLL